MSSQCILSSGSCSERTVVVLFLHGAGDTGPSFREWLSSITPLSSFTPKDAICLFPTAPKRPYTLLRGELANVWFDRPRLHYNEIEDASTLAHSISHLEGMLQETINSLSNEPLVYFVGFSMGGSMALHLAFHRFLNGASTHRVFVHSSFIGEKSPVIPNISDLNSTNFEVPHFTVIHGAQDNQIPCAWGLQTSLRLKEQGFSVQFQEIDGLGHQLSSYTIQLMSNFFLT